MLRRTALLMSIICFCCLSLLGCAQPEPTSLPPATRVAAQEESTAPPTATPLPPTVTPTQPPRIVLPDTKAYLRATPSDGGALIEVVVEQVERLYGAEVHLLFDPALAQVVDADPDSPGVNSSPGEVFPTGRSFAALNQADNENGKVDLALTLLNPAPALKGDFVIARFELLAEDEIEIRVEQLLLADNDGNPIRADVQESLTVEIDR